MEIITILYDMNTTLVTVLGYKLSVLEFAGTASGFACVWLTSREKILCWPVGIVNAIFFFLMFYQIRLYSDMFLQIYFFATSIYGWWKWTHPGSPEMANEKNELKITRLTGREFLITAAVIAVASLIMGALMASIHTLLPAYFPERAAYPYADSVVATASVVTQLVMARKKLECWVLWFFIDVLAVWIYLMKGINFVALEYGIFACIAVYGFLGWRRERAGYGEAEEAA